MLRIKSDMGMVAMQRYINKKAVKGYRLKSIVPFILFPPLHFIAFTFKKSATQIRLGILLNIKDSKMMI